MERGNDYSWLTNENYQSYRLSKITTLKFVRSSRKIDEIFQKIKFAQKITADELEAPMTAVTSRF